MGYFDKYIQITEPLPYRTEAEAVGEILAFTDGLCYALFTIRELWGEQLAMRGIVITPVECEAALLPSGDERTGRTKQERKVMGLELRAILDFLVARGGKGLEDGSSIRIWKLCQDFSLSPPEMLCFFLAAALEWDRKYERIYGYIQDNVAAKQPTLGLGLSLCGLLFGDGEEGPECGLSPDGFLFRCMLKGGRGTGTESRLSAPLVLNDTVWNYLSTGDWFAGPWKEIAALEAMGAKEVLRVSLRSLSLYRKEENRSLISMGGELMAAARGLSCRRILLACGEGEEGRNEAENEAGILEQVLAGGHILTERGVEGGRGRLTSLCTPVKTIYKWEDLILEEESKKMLRRICDQVKYRQLVKEEWGFGKKDPYGNGISALFFGPPGTGKTMAAQVMGSELKKELFKVDISRLISKYVGETEKQVSALFESAKRSGAVLFFDEADGLFAKRSEVNSSNDRYANTETGFLLQKLEEYDGISILATNYINNIDDAFKRRIRFHVRFPFPSYDMRLLLWKQMLPREAPAAEDLKLDSFARQFELSGSGIREVAIQTAFLAAAGGHGIRNEDIVEAIKMHYVKYGKHLGEGDFLWVVS